VSLDGLDLREDHDLLVADDSASFADKVIRLLNDRRFAEELGRTGQRSVRQRYSWQVSGQVLDEALHTLIRSKTPGMGPGRLRRTLYVIDLNPSLKYGSLEEQVFLLARAFQREGGLFLPLFPSPPGPEALAMYQASGLEVEWLNLDAFDFATLRRLLRLIRQHQIELLHWNLYYPLNPYICSLALLLPKLRHYLTDHVTRELPLILPPAGPRRAIKRVLLRRYSRVLCVSDFVRRRLEAESVWPNLRTCTHFINTERFRPDDTVRSHLRKEFDVADQFVVLVVAHLVEWKGVDVVLRALWRLPLRVVAWIVGDGPDASRLTDLCKTLGLETRVRFFGRQVDVSRYMQAADCLVCPTIWAEAAGLVILEGLACRLPVIASAVGGIPEFVDHGRTGFLFPPGDDAQLAERIRRLESDREACRRMGLEARSVMVERFSAGKRVSEYLDLYRVPARGGDHG
jgi:L-malate glycosyltransferase